MTRAAYKRYKPSGFAQPAEIPFGWSIRRGRFVFQVNPDNPQARSLDPGEEVSFVPMESVGEYGGLTLDKTKPLDEIGSGYTGFQDGDVVVAKITPCFENGKGALAAGLQNGVAYGTTELHVIRAGVEADHRFLFYLSISQVFRALGESEMYGAGGQKRVPTEFLKDFGVPLPSLEEQNYIVDFLDAKTAQIDALIDKKRSLIETLKEKRSALISRVVTRGLPPEAAKAAGLNPNPEMKDSGVAWFGEIPRYWNKCQLKWAVTFQRGHDLPADQREEGSVPLVTSAGISGSHSVAVASAPGIVTGRYGTIGHFHLVREDYWPLNTTLYSTDLHENSPEFICYMLEHLSPLVLLHSVKSAVPGVDRNDLHPTVIALPQRDEQDNIANYLSVETDRLDKLAAKVESVIFRLTEYRQSLITAAVTGKIDVRRIAA